MTTIISTLAPMGALYQRWIAGWGRPSQPARKSVAEEAAEVRALADSWRESDPGFAADLYAAVDRYEREHAQA